MSGERTEAALREIEKALRSPRLSKRGEEELLKAAGEVRDDRGQPAARLRLAAPQLGEVFGHVIEAIRHLEAAGR